MKTCKTCGQRKVLSEFYLAAGRPLSDCKPCWRARVKQRRLTDPSVRAYDRERAKLPHRRQMASAISKRWRERNPDAYRAQNALNNALRDGKVDRQPCQLCATRDSVHAHHRDYARPLDVTWLCARCHHRMHSLFPEMEGANKRASQ